MGPPKASSYPRPKWPNTTVFGNFLQENTVSEINNKVPLFLELEFQKLEFLISFPPWHCWVGFVRLKKFLWYSSLVNSSTIYTVLESTRLEYLFLKIKNKKKNLHSTWVYLYVYFLIIPKQEKKKKYYTVLEFTKLEYCVNFFFFLKGTRA